MAAQARRAFPLVVLLVALWLFLMPTPAVKAAPPDELDKVALTAVADAQALAPDELEVVNRTTLQASLQGGVVYVFKVMDRSGTLYEVALDASGAMVDAAALEAEAQAAYTARYGRLEPALAERLGTVDEKSPLEVILWLQEPDYVGPARPAPDATNLTDADIEAFFAEVDAQRAAAVAPIVAQALSQLRALGVEATGDTYTPVVYATLTRAQVEEVAKWETVDTVYLARTHEPELEVARATINADVVHSRGITGSGVRVAQIEVGGRIATANPYLSGTVQDTTYVCSTASAHSTGVAGIIRSTHSTRRGIAPGATLWAGGSCGGTSSQLQNRSTAAADWGARALNLSWGSDTNLVPSADDRFYDDMVINRYRTIVKSAGNRGTTGCSGTDGDVTSPGLAYNVITVGNFDDKNTTSWSGDTMNACSSWRDPISARSDREKPELAAPGTTINSTTTASPWTGAIGSGTSYAAPMVTGAAALLIQRSSSLSAWPEAIKAILMATAVHNVEGSTRLSEYDGAGAIVLDRADDVARRVNGNWGAQSYACSAPTTTNVTTMSLTAGVRTRVTIVWDTDDSYSSYATQPAADLDLRILNSANSIVASSSSWDNTYEIVEFTPSTSGTYTLQVYKYRCSYEPRWLGWAWYRGN